MVVTEIIDAPLPIILPIAPELLVPCKELMYWKGMTIINLIEQYGIGIAEEVICSDKLNKIESNNNDRTAQ